MDSTPGRGPLGHVALYLNHAGNMYQPQAESHRLLMLCHPGTCLSLKDQKTQIILQLGNSNTQITEFFSFHSFNLSSPTDIKTVKD
jgi:hypothetical protein